MIGPFSNIALLSAFCITTALAAPGNAAWASTPFSPAAVPLAVRSPYLSAWLPQGAGTPLTSWPQFWTGQTLGWAGYVRVDNKTYNWLGTPGTAGAIAATQKSLNFTSTASTFVLTAGPVDVTAMFLSPVEPNDLLKQSIPFSYLSVSVASNDGKPHQVQVYSDISAEWISSDLTAQANWTTSSTGNIIMHQVQLANQTVYSEKDDQSQYGAAYYTTHITANATFQSGADNTVRAQFIANGTLTNGQDSNFRAVQDNFPVFGLAHDLGTVGTAASQVLFSVGHVRDPAIKYIVAGDQFQDRHSYFWSNYTNVHDVVSDFMADYPSALTRAQALDAQVASDAGKISQDYADLVSLSVRQAMGGIEVTISKDSSGNYNTTDTLVFLKEISSDGNVNTVDVIFPAWPAYMYLNPTLGKHLLEPLFQYQATGQYPNKWSVHDMGAHYPIANGHNDGKDESMPVEECGNMLIMALMYSQRTGDKSLLQQYSGLLDQWTQFLISDSLIPANQISTDDFAGSLANQTNLAIKGIIGIRAMANIWSLLGNNQIATNYTNIANMYVTQWQKLATASTGDHLTLSYGQDNTWGLTYNLWADKALGLNIFPASVYQMQAAWYKKQLPTSKFGVQLDTRHTYTKSDWQIFTAAFVPDLDLRNSMISAVKSYAGAGANDAPLSDFYDTVTGKTAGFRNRPVVGGHLALLVLNTNATLSLGGSASSISSSPSGSPSPTPSFPSGSERVRTPLVLLTSMAGCLLLFISF